MEDPSGPLGAVSSILQLQIGSGGVPGRDGLSRNAHAPAADEDDFITTSSTVWLSRCRCGRRRLLAVSRLNSGIGQSGRFVAAARSTRAVDKAKVLLAASRKKLQRRA